ncbi:16S rRNA (cytosine967-C5)-methyltransferase [Roseovarius nanhaiticus]|uniref:16S rRNA (Cytosine967-C5)-methyltransferase n=1 Tax=Roseovarius nanhaiticus TaxID=573024 RepID=A0A1N7HHJ2_9RHOB|nr:RsmB/NOP family class I SAM-dependent RNA methyltransferase [Roseovarius nanhaiticus]SEK93769.1 16S rRNA (cytosine967-C5)-methyltransferase [Roseovarius nanhaiticus]SIS24346.1 16S rRNA (cytosine967-C5)-methyltransferase [Roseovarius nanhaiticus]
MTPGARIQAAIDVLDRIGAGTPAEKALTGWARGARFAGSGDRAAVRDHVYQALRCWRSYACLGGGDTGRARMIGALRAADLDPDTLFTGEGHAPAPLSEAERGAGSLPSGADAHDLPDWLWAQFQSDLGEGAARAALALRERAPVMLRVNLARAGLQDVISLLAEDGIHSEPHPIAKSALLVIDGARRVARSRAYLDGLAELQDGSGQAAMEAIPLPSNGGILDYCAGGGGKALALAAQGARKVYAHDIDAARMADLPARAARSGADVEILDGSKLVDKAPYSLILCDAPCSGSGTWRRTPDAKWRLTPERLDELKQMQSAILREAAQLVGSGGRLIYATCSVLHAENEARIDAFLQATPNWHQTFAQRFDVSDGGDGFFVAHLARI